MAGDVRQPVDVPSLSKYLELHAPEITLPVGIKQVLGPSTLLDRPSLIGI